MNAGNGIAVNSSYSTDGSRRRSLPALKCTRRRWLMQLGTAVAAPFRFGRVAVIAHRGAHAHAPENSLEACEAAVELGCDFAELDVRTSSDGVLVLNHDSTRNGVPVRDMHSREFAHFDDALAILEASGVYVDLKSAAVPAVVAMLRRHRMTEKCVVYCGRLEALDQFVAEAPEIRIMPEAGSAANLRKHFARWPKLKAVAFDHRDFEDEAIGIAREAKAGVFVDRLGPNDVAAEWRKAIERGATGIQTDKPHELISFLRT